MFSTSLIWLIFFRFLSYREVFKIFTDLLLDGNFCVKPSLRGYMGSERQKKSIFSLIFYEHTK